jgi:stearoyl-CoA desaturase (delta-9 desaturase)
MNQWIWALAFFAVGYVANMFYITVLYHRGLTHRAVALSSFATWLVSKTGVWVTGIDPLTWACMHRLHHEYSDTKEDPHSPVHYGVFGVAIAQLKSYEKIAARLTRGDSKLKETVADIPFGVSATNQNGRWYLPYVVHFLVATLLAFAFQSVWVGIGAFAGFMSHPVQGWLVNSFAHKYGYQNYSLDDHSRNNHWVSWVAFGEGYQNNHHAYPAKANFAHQGREIDLGYGLCRIAQSVGLLKIRTSPSI